MRRMFANGRYANVTATLALIVALGGTGAYAANTIRSSDIRNGQVKRQDLASNAVTSAKVRNWSLQRRDLRRGSVTSATVRNGTLLRKDFRPDQLPAAGPSSPAGPAGAPGTARAAAMVSAPAPSFVPVFTGDAKTGFAGVGRPSSPTANVGIYCLFPAPGVNVRNAAPIASADWFHSDGANLMVHPLAQPRDCQAGTLEVRTYRFEGRRAAQLSNVVAFSVVLP